MLLVISWEVDEEQQMGNNGRPSLKWSQQFFLSYQKNE